MKLQLERRDQDNKTLAFGNDAAVGLVSPLVDEDYWQYRVIVGEHQAVVGFPKYSTIGIGFAVEGDDWNSNAPYTKDTDYIWQRIKGNKGDEAIPDEWCIEAIQMIQAAAATDRQVSQ